MRERRGQTVDYELDGYLVEFKEALEAFLKERVAPMACGLETLGVKEKVSRLASIVAELGGNGFLNPFRQDGTPDMLRHCLAAEAISRVSPSVFLCARAGAFLCAHVIGAYGTDEQKEACLRDLVTGRSLGAFCYSEPTAGVDMGSVSARAMRKGGRWLLGGLKDLVVNAPCADVYVILARTDGSHDDEEGGGFSLFIVRRGSKGLEVGDAVETMGMRGVPVGAVGLKDCASLGVIGGVTGRGLEQTRSVFSLGAVGIAAMCTGISQACMEISTEHARTRTAFGRPIGMYQEIGFKLADMYTLVDLSRMMALRAAWAFDNADPDAPVLAACAKLFASEAAVRVAHWGMQIFAGRGYVSGTDMERIYRDARFGEICEGTSEILRDAVAASELDRFSERI